MDGSSLKTLVDSPVPEYWGNINMFNTRHYCTTEDMWYLTPKQKKLLAACMEHAKENEVGAHYPHAVYVVHPFFHSFCGHSMEGFEYDEYVSSLGTLLRFAERPRFDTVLFEIPEHYALKTWENAERGEFDAILFTQFGFGRLLDCSFQETGMRKRLKNVRKIGCAGSYVAGLRSACVYEAISQTPEREVAYPIVDALLPSVPHMKDELIRWLFDDLGTLPEEFRMVEDMIVPASEL